MNEWLILSVFVGTSSALGIFVLFDQFYRDYRVDRFRHQLFVLRNRLVAMAVNGKISVEDPAYKQVSGLINGFLRFGHKVEFGWALAVANSIRKEESAESKDYRTTLTHSISSLKDADVRDEIGVIWTEVNFRLIEQLFLTSFIVWALIFPIALANGILESLASWRWVKGRIVYPLDKAALAAAA